MFINFHRGPFFLKRIADGSFQILPAGQAPVAKPTQKQRSFLGWLAGLLEKDAAVLVIATVGLCVLFLILVFCHGFVRFSARGMRNLLVGGCDVLAMVYDRSVFSF